MTSQLPETHSTPAGRWIDRRASERIDVNMTGTIDFAGAASDIRASRVRLLNVSAGGATVEVTGDYPHGVILVLRIDSLGEFEAEKRWSSNDHTMGLKFIDAHSETYKIARS